MLSFFPAVRLTDVFIAAGKIVCKLEEDMANCTFKNVTFFWDVKGTGKWK